LGRHDAQRRESFMAANNLFLVFTNPVPGQAVPFDDWYENTHIADVLAVPGVLSAQRYAMTPVETPEVEGAPAPSPPQHGYLVVYELDRDANAVMADFVERVSSGSMELSEALDMSSVALSVWQPLGDRHLAVAQPGTV
jgi:hypothetical protein